MRIAGRSLSTRRLVAAVALAVAGCGDSAPSGPDFSVTFESSARSAQPVRVEVYLVDACDDVVLGARPVPASANTYVHRNRTGALGEVAPGDYGLYAVAQDADCAVVAAGCAPVAITGADDTLEVTLSSLRTGGCGAGVTCSVNLETGDCVEGSGGSGGTGGSDASGGSGGMGGLGGVGGTGGAPVTRASDGLIALYDFDEGQDATVLDKSGVGTALDLTIEDPSNVTWGPDHLTIVSGTRLVTSGPATKIYSEVVPNREITVEAWVRPSTLVATGTPPDRIVSMSSSGTVRNFLLGQDATSYATRFRTAGESNGNPTIYTSAASARLELQHVVFTHAADGSEVIYIDGAVDKTNSRPDDLGTWDPTLPLVVANEVSAAREWLGELHLIAIYDRALESAEVEQNFEAGP